MPCEEFTELASQNFETPVSFRDRLRMLWHRIECVYCRRFLAQLKRIHYLLTAPPPEQPMPDAMRESLRRKLTK
jgi:hypothetical protein